jgi:uncharacterized protein with PQ loop repeat
MPIPKEIKLTIKIYFFYFYIIFYDIVSIITIFRSINRSIHIYRTNGANYNSFLSLSFLNNLSCFVFVFLFFRYLTTMDTLKNKHTMVQPFFISSSIAFTLTFIVLIVLICRLSSSQRIVTRAIITVNPMSPPRKGQTLPVVGNV